MNEDLKAKLKEKLGALVTDEQLDEVAGGTYAENLEILNAMAQLDFEGVQSVFSKINDPTNHSEDIGSIISNGVSNLILKHFPLSVAPSNKSNNFYMTTNGGYISQDEMLKMINNKAKLKAAGASDDWVVY